MDFKKAPNNYITISLNKVFGLNYNIKRKKEIENKRK